MKQKLKKEFWDLSTIDLEKKSRELKDSIAELKINRYTKQSKNIRETKTLRQQLAVVESIKRIKELSV